MIKDIYTNKKQKVNEDLLKGFKSFASKFSLMNKEEKPSYASAGKKSDNHERNKVRNTTNNPIAWAQMFFKGTNMKDAYVIDYSHSESVRQAKEYINKIFLTQQRIANTAHDDIVNIFIDHIEALFQKKLLTSIMTRAEDHIGNTSKEYVLYLTTKQGEYKVVIGELNFFIDNGTGEVWYKNNDPKGLFRDGTVRKFIQGIVK